jgi:hypothetical protein
VGGTRALQPGDARGVQIAALKEAVIRATIETSTEIRPFSMELLDALRGLSEFGSVLVAVDDL